MLCSNDPICAQHSADDALEGRWLLGAACHGCTLVGESSCEMHNDYLNYFLGSGLVWAVVSLVDGTTELAIGAHFANNIWCLLEGKEAVRQWMATTYGEPPTFAVAHMIAEGDFVVALGTITTKDEDGDADGAEMRFVMRSSLTWV